MTQAKTAPWQESTCRAPMWMAGIPAGLCGDKAYGHQLPRDYLLHTQGHKNFPFCFQHACPNHGGPQGNEVRIFQDGLTDDGRQMWCAVMPDFVNLQESHAGFDKNPVRAVENLLYAIKITRR